jgi:hypothetical protein
MSSTENISLVLNPDTYFGENYDNLRNYAAVDNPAKLFDFMDDILAGSVYGEKMKKERSYEEKLKILVDIHRNTYELHKESAKHRLIIEKAILISASDMINNFECPINIKNELFYGIVQYAEKVISPEVGKIMNATIRAKNPRPPHVALCFAPFYGNMTSRQITEFASITATLNLVTAIGLTFNNATNIQMAAFNIGIGQKKQLLQMTLAKLGSTIPEETTDALKHTAAYFDELHLPSKGTSGFMGAVADIVLDTPVKRHIGSIVTTFGEITRTIERAATCGDPFLKIREIQKFDNDHLTMALKLHNKILEGRSEFDFMKTEFTKLSKHVYSLLRASDFPRFMDIMKFKILRIIKDIMDKTIYPALGLHDS